MKKNLYYINFKDENRNCLLYHKDKFSKEELDEMIEKANTIVGAKHSFIVITFLENCYGFKLKTMNLIETEFSTDMNEHSEIRHEILDISNFIKRLPTMISEVVE